MTQKFLFFQNFIYLCKKVNDTYSLSDYELKQQNNLDICVR